MIKLRQNYLNFSAWIIFRLLFIGHKLLSEQSYGKQAFSYFLAVDCQLHTLDLQMQDLRCRICACLTNCMLSQRESNCWNELCKLEKHEILVMQLRKRLNWAASPTQPIKLTGDFQEVKIGIVKHYSLFISLWHVGLPKGSSSFQRMQHLINALCSFEFAGKIPRILKETLSAHSEYALIVSG
jgi:hypothetical protein